ncbi:MAG: hypothetical protein GY714_06970 [Desulfobacterales bacterium]|nr:hypothetical protein [Desulfobacterales bacterium]MCP4161808.1 hypothetical protein [Deltaproteobacteria bacterium]
MMRGIFVFIFFCFFLVLICGAAYSKDSDDIAIDLDFEIEEVEKKPYSINFDFEAKETIKIFDKDALLFKQKYPDKNNEDTFLQTDFDLTIEGQSQINIIKMYGRFNGTIYYNEDENQESEEKIEEAYVTIQPSFSLSIDVGKKVHKWGKGYAFNPSAFFSRPKNIDDPDATLEGYYSFSMDYIKSMTGILKTVAITPVIMPINRDFNNEFGLKDGLVWGGKIYFFAFNTDIDIMFQTGDIVDNRIGFDFSNNLTPSFEIHGDAALVEDYKKFIIDDSGNTSEKDYTAINFLLGLRYLSGLDTTYIFEYYRNGQGYSSKEYENYLTLIEKGYNQYTNTSDTTDIFKSKTYSTYYNQQTAMRDYLYLKISQKEPFDLLYFTPAITVIYNINDYSASITPQITYTPITNLTLDMKAGLLFGESKTEYGEKINNARVLLSIKYYF